MYVCMGLYSIRFSGITAALSSAVYPHAKKIYVIHTELQQQYKFIVLEAVEN